MSIRKLLSISFVAFIVILIIIGAVSVLSINKLSMEATQAVYGNELRSEILQKEIDHLKWAEKLKAFIDNKKLEKLEIQTDSSKCAFGKWYYGEDRKAAEKAFPEIEASLKAIDSFHENLHKSAIAVENAAIKEHNPVKAQNIYLTETIPNLRKVQENLGKINEIIQNDVKKLNQQMISDSRNISIAILLVSIIAILAGIIMIATIPRSIIRCINRTIDVVKDIASGGGDMTKRIPMPKRNCSSARNCGKKDCPEYGKDASCWDTVGSNAPGEIHCPSILSGKYKDCTECPVMQSAMSTEMDELAGWINTFIGKISEIIRQVKNTTEKVNSSSEYFSEVSSKLAAGSEELTAQSTTVAGAAEQLNANINSVAGSAEEMSANSQNVSSASDEISENMAAVSSAAEQGQNNLSSVAVATEEMTATVNEIAHNTERAREITDEAVNSVLQASSKVQDLSNASNEINQVIATINEIAEQTKLLALNATIEAARAGEAGKGFAVVANEVKELAKQTNEATNDIRERIEAMQNSTTVTIEEISKIEKVVSDVSSIVGTIAAAVEEQNVTMKENSKNVTQGADGIREIAEKVNSVNANISEISQNISELSLGAKEVSRQVQEAALGVQEVSSNMNGVSTVAKETSEGAQQINTSAEDLKTIAKELTALVSRFKV
jgi:methyl-accepting chemotaxis protein